MQKTNISYSSSIYFINDNTGYAAGIDEKISRTTNAGLTWSLQHSGIGNRLSSIYFFNENTGFACGTSGTILKTINGGDDWVRQISGTNSNLVSVNFSNENKGYATSDDGKVLYTSDGGNKWSIQYSEYNNFSVIQFPASDTGYISAYGWYVLKTTTGGILTSFNSVQSIVPENYYLAQNYPNPFNPKTIINYELGITNFVSLKVYNVLGNEVATLVNESKTSGSYEVEFEGSDFASGIYFYRIEAGDFIATKKMVLLK